MPRGLDVPSQNYSTAVPASSRTRVAEPPDLRGLSRWHFGSRAVLWRHGARKPKMAEHGAVGRRYAGTVRQIISGSIGFDDWEWGVDLFVDDPLVLKKLIYEMRFDEVSAMYALFGAFFVGRRLTQDSFAELLSV